MSAQDELQIIDDSVPFYALDLLHSDLIDSFHRSLDDVLRSSAFIGGPMVERFEAIWADFCSVENAIGVANGTDAIELVLRALDIGPGDEVIVPANTFVATASAVVAVGASPCFVDVDPGTLLLQADNVRAAIGPRTAAVLAVHLYGQPVDVVGLRSVTDRLGIPIIEDAAQAHGAELYGRRAGSLGVAATFSFYPGKNLGALGDGGAITTNDPILAERVRVLANHGRGRNHHDHVEIGRNSRLDGLQAAFLLAKLPRLLDENARRRAIAGQYRDALHGLPIEFVTQRHDALSAVHLMVAQVSDRAWFQDQLAQREIGTSVHYPTPCHRQPAFAAYTPGYLPVVERAAGRIVSLPMFPHLSEARIARVIDAVTEVLSNSSGSRGDDGPMITDLRNA